MAFAHGRLGAWRRRCRSEVADADREKHAAGLVTPRTRARSSPSTCTASATPISRACARSPTGMAPR
jgi:hypothetical protein